MGSDKLALRLVSLLENSKDANNPGKRFSFGNRCWTVSSLLFGLITARCADEAPAALRETLADEAMAMPRRIGRKAVCRPGRLPV